MVAFGSIEAEDARNLTPLNFIKLFRLAQLTVEYLLFVQDRLAADNCALKVRAGGRVAHLLGAAGAGARWCKAKIETASMLLRPVGPSLMPTHCPRALRRPPARQGELGKLHGHVEVLQLKVKEQREEAAAGKKELRQLKRSMRTLEVGWGHGPPRSGASTLWGAAAEQGTSTSLPTCLPGSPVPPPQAVALAQRPPAPAPQPEVQVVERVVEAADPVAQYKLERMEAEVRELTEEREAMQRWGQGWQAGGEAVASRWDGGPCTRAGQLCSTQGRAELA